MMDDAFEDDEVDAEADDVTNSVLEEIGIDMASKVIYNLTHKQKTTHYYLFICFIIDGFHTIQTANGKRGQSGCSSTSKGKVL